MTTGTLTLGRPAHLRSIIGRSIIAGFTAAGLAVGLTAGILVTREVLGDRVVPTVQAQAPTAIWENSAAAVREQGAVLSQARSAFENSTAAVREQGAILPWYVVAARAGFTGRLGGATEERFTPVRRHGHLTPKSSVFDQPNSGPIVVNGEPCHRCL